MQHKNTHMENIIVVGGGPIGLYTAIKLKQAGVLSVTVIDPIAGAYTRPGDLDEKVFIKLEEKVNKRVNTKVKRKGKQKKEEITFSSSRHIKDAERSLYSIAQELGVNFQKKKFKAFIRKGLVVADAEQKEEVIPCDLAFDCTGAKRTLVHAANEEATEAIFKIEPVAKNPLENHFFAYVKIEEGDSALIENYLAIEQLKMLLKKGVPDIHYENDIRKELQKREEALPKHDRYDPVTHSLAMEKLYSLGWTEFAEPFFEFRIVQKNKVMFYYEIPENLKSEDYEAWLAAIAELKAGKPIVIERIKSDKPIFLPFKVQPKKLTSGIFEGDEMLPIIIVPLGDSLIQYDYRLGRGIKLSSEKVDAFLSSIEIIDGQLVSIDKNSYQKKLNKLLREDARRIQGIYNNRKLDILRDNLREAKRYREALKQSNPDEASLFKERLAKLEEKLPNIIDEIYSLNCDAVYFYKKILSAFEINYEDVSRTISILKNVKDNEARHFFLLFLLAVIASNERIDVLNKLLKEFPPLTPKDLQLMIRLSLPNVIKAHVLNYFLLEMQHNEANRLELQFALDAALRSAIEAKNWDEAKKIIDIGANVNQFDNDGCTLIYKAAKKRDDELLKNLIALGANPNLPNIANPISPAGFTSNTALYAGKLPLIETIKARSVSTAIELLKGKADPTLKDKEGHDALYYIRYYGMEEISDWLPSETVSSKKQATLTMFTKSGSNKEKKKKKSSDAPKKPSHRKNF